MRRAIFYRRERENVPSLPCGNAKNFYAIIHEIGWRDQTHLKKRTENIRENYTPERATERGTRGESPSHSRNLLQPRNAMDLLLEFRRFEVEKRRFSPLGEAKWWVRKRTREWQGKVTTRAAKSNGWRTGKWKEEHAKKDRARKSSHLPTPEASSLRSVDSDRAKYQEFSNFKGRYTRRPMKEEKKKKEPTRRIVGW
jgi:hypothetical protein